MKKWITRIIIAVLLIGAFAGVGMFAYHVGYQQGTQGINGGMPSLYNRSEQFNQNPHFGRNEMPQFHPGFNQGPERRFGNDRFSMMDRGRGFGFFSPFQFLFRIAIIGFVIWLGYKLFKGNGWQLSLSRQTANDEVESKTPKKKSTKSKA